MRSALHVFLALLCVGSARPVAASELVIEWSGPPSCPDQADIVSRVEHSLGDAVKTNLTATVDVTQTEDNFHARLRITSSAGFGERILENTRCEILADSVALVIALSASRPAGSRGEITRYEQDDLLVLALSVHATAVAGPLPRLALGAGGTLAVEGFSALRLELSGTYYAQQSSRFDQTNVGARFRLLRFGARGCRVWVIGVLDLAPCLGAELYRIAGVGFGGMVTNSGETLMWGPALGVFGRLRLSGRFAVYLAADGVAPVSRQRFVFSDVGPLHRPSALAFQMFVAPEVQF